jgi:hypothetical protein
VGGMKNDDDEASSGGTFWRMARRRELRDSGITHVPACIMQLQWWW